MPDGTTFAGPVGKTPNWMDGYIPSAAEWNAWWAMKLDASDALVTQGPYVRLSGDTMTGRLTLAVDPVAPLDAVTKGYLDSLSFLPLAGGQMTGPLLLSREPQGLSEAATKSYVDAHSGTGGGAGYVPLSGGTMLGLLTLSGAPTASLHAATKAYVDSTASAAGVLSFNTRVGAVLLTQTDVTTALTYMPTSPAYVATAVATAYTNVGRNLVHNPLFNVQQRGLGPWSTNNVYTADRWLLGVTSDAVSVAVAAVTDAARAQVGDEAMILALQNTFTGNAAAGASSYIEQRLESVRRLAGKTVTLSFYAQGTAGIKLGVNAYQWFGTGGSPSTFVQVLTTGLAVTLAATWARYTVTLVIPSAAGKVLGNNGDDATWIRFVYSSGATGNAAAGNIGVQSGIINIWGVQLEIGSVATPLEKPDPRYDLSNCERFYQFGGASAYGTTSAGAYIGNAVNLRTQMRAAPTINFTGTGYSNASAITLVFTSPWYFNWGAPVTSGGAGAFVTSNFTASADL